MNRGELVGVVETPTRPWWVRIVEAERLPRPGLRISNMGSGSGLDGRYSAPDLDKLLTGSRPLVVGLEMGAHWTWRIGG